jgi:cation diffusion facilitator CzcD-associated flavoprotein CzcO
MLMSIERVQTLVVGGGQAGLAMSHMLTKRGCPGLWQESEQRPR